MKKKIFTLALAFIVSLSLLKAEETSKPKHSVLNNLHIGGGIKTSGFSSMGPYIHGVYTINEFWEGSAQFAFFPFSRYFSGMSLDLNGHFSLNQFFVINEMISTYALGGLKIGSGNLVYYYDYNYNNNRYNRTGLGINIGSGTRIKITDNLYFDGEVSYTFGGIFSFNVGGGILYKF